MLLEDTDSESGLILLSKHKADRIRGWENIINTKKEGDVVKGKVVRRIKGGLLVDIGVPVFLPASQVDIRKPGDISRFIGKEVECIVLKIDIEGRNIVISRRKLIEEERRLSKEKILAEIEVGQIRKGIVKNIADFGVFVDLGGVDGLLHISDLSWGRVSHPSEVVRLDEEIECVVIGVDKANEKISLGLKQKSPSPWENVENEYPVGSRVKGKVVNIMNYGVFVRLEDGIEGLVHISEMSWTKRLNHPSEMLNLGDEIEVMVLNVNKDKQEISLGLKQTETNPWSVAAQKYPPGTIVNGDGSRRYQLRRVCRDRRRHRRDDSYFGPELDEKVQPSERGAAEGRQGQVRGSRYRPGQAAGFAGRQAVERGPVASRDTGEIYPRADRQRQGNEADEFRSVCAA